MSPSTTLQDLGGSNSVHVAHMRMSFGLSWYSASFCDIFCSPARARDIAPDTNHAAVVANAACRTPRRKTGLVMAIFSGIQLPALTRPLVIQRADIDRRFSHAGIGSTRELAHFLLARLTAATSRAVASDFAHSGLLQRSSPSQRRWENDMPLTKCGMLARRCTAVCAFLLAWALALTAVRAEDKTYVMKITLPTINEGQHLFAKNYAAAVERDSGGRIKGEVYPASQLGSIPRQIEGTQFGAIQCAVIPPEFFVGVDERFEVMAAPGLVDSMAHGERLAADPAVLKLMLGLGADKGLHGVALFMNAPQSVIAKSPIRRLADFQGKKIRVLASPFQTQAFARLGATPVAMTLGDVVPAMQQGAIDGALGGIVVWTPMHFQDAAKYVTETGQPAIFAIAVVSKSWYDSLPADLQKLID